MSTALLETDLVLVQIQPSTFSRRRYFAYAMEAVHLSIYIERRILLPASKFHLIDLIIGTI